MEEIVRSKMHGLGQEVYTTEPWEVRRVRACKFKKALKKRSKKKKSSLCRVILLSLSLEYARSIFLRARCRHFFIILPRHSFTIGTPRSKQCSQASERTTNIQTPASSLFLPEELSDNSREYYKTQAPKSRLTRSAYKTLRAGLVFFLCRLDERPLRLVSRSAAFLTATLPTPPVGSCDFFFLCPRSRFYGRPRREVVKEPLDFSSSLDAPYTACCTHSDAE